MASVAERFNVYSFEQFSRYTHTLSVKAGDHILPGRSHSDSPWLQTLLFRICFHFVPDLLFISCFTFRLPYYFTLWTTKKIRIYGPTHDTGLSCLDVSGPLSIWKSWDTGQPFRPQFCNQKEVTFCGLMFLYTTYMYGVDIKTIIIFLIDFIFSSSSARSLLLQSYSSSSTVALGGVVVSVLATGPKVRGFKPGRWRWILRMIKSVARLPSEGK
jgi:hypothetical protein